MSTYRASDGALVEQLRRLELVGQITRQLAATLDLDHILAQTVAQVQAALDCYAVSLGLIEGAELEFRALMSKEYLSGAPRTHPYRLPLAGPGLTVQAARTNQVVYAPDVAHTPHDHADPSVPAIRSELAMPFALDGKVVGVIDVTDDRPDAFSKDDMALLELLAHHIAAAVRNAQLHQAVQRQLKQMAVVQQISAEIARPTELSALMTSILEHTARLLGATGGAIYLYDPNREELEAVTSYGSGQAYQSMRLRLGEGAAGRVVQYGQPLIIRDYQTWEGRAHVYDNGPFRSIISHPLIIDDRVIGALNLSHDTRAGYFTEDDSRLLSLLTNQIAVAIEKARLFEETQQRMRELGAVMAVSSAANQSLELSELLELALDKLLAVTGFEGGALALVDPRHQGLHVAASRAFSEAMLQDLRAHKDSEGLRGRVLTTGQPVYLSDFANMPAYQERAATREGYRATALLPLISKGQSLGLLGVALRQPHDFSPMERRLLESVAAQLALSIAHAQLYDESRHQVDRFKLLNEVNQHVVSLLSSHQLFREVVALIHQTFHYPYVAIALVEDGEVVFQAASGDDPNAVARSVNWRVPLERKTIVTQVVKTAQTYLTNQAANDPFYRPPFDSFRAGSELAVPIKLRDELIGVLNIESREAGAFDDGDRVVMETLAALLAVTIANARLFADISRERQRLAVVLDHVADGVLIADRQGIVQMANSSASRLFGIEAERLQGLRCEQLIGLESRRVRLADLFQAVIAERKTIAPGGHRAVLTTGPTLNKIVTLSLMPIADAVRDEVAHVVMALWDISREQKIDQMRDEFIAIASHELRSPLWNLGLALHELAQERLNKKRRQELIAIVQSQVRRLHQFSDQLLSATEAQTASVLRQPVSLSLLLERVVGSYRHAARGRPFQLVMPDALPTVQGDAEKLESVLSNLIDNALKYSYPDTPIVVEAALSTPGEIIISVSDQGDGMTQAMADTLFQPFHRLPQGRQRAIKGHGLGLYIVKTFVEAHGGHIGVRSRVGEGSTFWFTLPVAPSEEAS